MKKVVDYFRITIIFIHTIIAAFIGTPLLLLGPKRALYLISNYWAEILLTVCGVKIKVNKLKELDYETPKIYVCNHESNIDIPCLMRSIKEPIFFVAKKELKVIPFLGWYMSAVGMIFVDRSDRKKSIQSMEQAAQEIKSGKSIFSFPEGTRTRDGSIGMFKRGTFRIAINSGVEIVPLAIKGAKEVIPATKFQINPGNVKIAIGEPIDSTKWSLNEVDDMADHVKKEVIKLRATL